MDSEMAQAHPDVMLYGNDGSTFPMTRSEWEEFLVNLDCQLFQLLRMPPGYQPTYIGQELCTNIAECLEINLAERGSEEWNASVNWQVDMFYANAKHVHQLIEFLRSCWGFTVDKEKVFDVPARPSSEKPAPGASGRDEYFGDPPASDAGSASLVRGAVGGRPLRGSVLVVPTP